MGFGTGIMHGPPTLFMSAFWLIFFVIVGVIVFQVVRGITTWSHNNAQPVLTVEAHIVSRRTEVSRNVNHHHNNHHYHSSRTTYYVTFEVESRDRMEFNISGQEYGLLAEGDQGRLTFQGSRYHGFERYR